LVLPDQAFKLQCKEFICHIFADRLILQKMKHIVLLIKRIDQHN